MAKYSIYGDDDQQRLAEIFEEEEEIQLMVDIETKKVLKDRQKKQEKKETLDSSINVEKPEAKIEDITPAQPAIKKVEFNKEEAKKKEKKAKSEKKKNQVIVKFVIFLFFVLLLFGFFVSIGGIDTIKKAADNMFNSINTNLVKTEKETEASGYIDSANEKEYSLKEILSYAGVASDALQSYYGRLQEIANLSKSGDVQDVNAQIKADIESDSASFATYLPYFKEYEGGENYHNSIMKRFDNIEELVTTIDYIDSNKIYEYVNSYVEKENSLIIDSKNELINFLDLNGISYIDKGNTVEFGIK